MYVLIFLTPGKHVSLQTKVVSFQGIKDENKTLNQLLTCWVNSVFSIVGPWYLGTGSAWCLGRASWKSILAPLCSPVSSFSLCDTVAGPESCGVTQSSTVHLSIVCQTRWWWKSAAVTCRPANGWRGALVVEVPGDPLPALSPGCAVSFASVVSYFLACIFMEFFNHTCWWW